jgi:hypothetical protein
MMSHRGPLQALYGFKAAEDATSAVTQSVKYWAKLNLFLMTLLNCVVFILSLRPAYHNLDKKYLAHKLPFEKTFSWDFSKIFCYFQYIFLKCSPDQKNGVPAYIDLIYARAVSL